MRRSRRLTATERWELGVFLGLLMLGCVGLVAVLGSDRIPHLFAMMFEPAAAGSDSAPLHAVGEPSPVASPTLPAIFPPSPAYFPPSPAISPPSPAGVATGQLGLAEGTLDPSLVPGEAELLKPGKKAAEDIKWYKGEKYRYVRTLRLRVTAYAADPRCCWPYSGTTTASGLSVKTNHGKLAAADTAVIPMHALVAVPGYDGGAAVPVLDRGGAIKGSRLDVLLPSFEQAEEWGARVLSVKIYIPVD